MQQPLGSTATYLKLLCIICCLFSFAVYDTDADTIVKNIHISRTMFNPSQGESCDILFKLTDAAKVTLYVLDRDGFITRTLLSNMQSHAGAQLVKWDGRNEKGTVVPDEAYSLKIDVNTDKSKGTYFPANGLAEDSIATIQYYDRQNGILKYSLNQPSRVHAQAGCATTDPATKASNGPVMKTIVNREPRIAGSIIESWNGYDESGTIYVPDLPNFAMSIAASALPENSIITIGNHSKSFIASIPGRSGQSQFTVVSSEHHHHQGLSTTEDVSPKLSLTPINAQWNQEKQSWITKGESISIRVKVEGQSINQFISQPGSIWLFVDGTKERQLKKGSANFEFSLKVLSPGVHIISINWGSEFGPTAANSFRIVLENESNHTTGKN